MNINPQIRQLRSRHDVVIATPGRLKDLVTRKVIKLESFSNVVLDEADRMLDMGFIGEIRFFLSKLSSPRHTLLFSATMPREIEKLVSEFLTNPIQVSVKTRETSAQIDQDIVRIERGQDKLDVLDTLLKQAHFQKVLVFGRTKYGCEKLSKKLSQRGHKATAIHGNKSHNQRQRALQQFKKGQMDILVATDVAARGLDIPNVSHVINYDVPATYEDYTHRIGRTGRAGKTGIALTFIE